MVQLKGYKMNHLEIDNKVKNGTQLKLQNKVKYNVNYLADSNRCLGVLEFTIADIDGSPFEVKIEMIGEFTYDYGDEKPDIHTASFDQIFPFLRMAVNTLTSISGMPPLMIPIMRLNKDTVTVNEPIYRDESGNGLLN